MDAKLLHVSNSNCMVIGLGEYGFQVLKAIHNSRISNSITAIYTTPSGWCEYSQLKQPFIIDNEEDFSGQWWDENLLKGQELLIKQFTKPGGVAHHQQIQHEGAMDIFIIAHLNEVFGCGSVNKVRNFVDETIGVFKRFQLTMILGFNSEKVMAIQNEEKGHIRKGLIEIEKMIKSPRLGRNGDLMWCYLHDQRDQDGYIISHRRSVDTIQQGQYSKLIQAHCAAEFLLVLISGLVDQREYYESNLKFAISCLRDKESEAHFSTFNAASVQLMVSGGSSSDEASTLQDMVDILFHSPANSVHYRAKDVLKRFNETNNYFSYQLDDLLKETLPLFTQMIRPLNLNEIELEEVSGVIRNWNSLLWNKWQQEQKIPKSLEKTSKEQARKIVASVNGTIDDMIRRQAGGIELAEEFLDQFKETIQKQKIFPGGRPRQKEFWFIALLNRIMGTYFSKGDSKQTELDCLLEKFEKYLSERVNRPALFSRNTMFSTGILASVLLSILGIVPFVFTGILVLLFSTWGVGLLLSIIRLYLEDMRLHRACNQAIHTVQKKYWNMYYQKQKDVKCEFYEEIISLIYQWGEKITDLKNKALNIENQIKHENTRYESNLLTTKEIFPYQTNAQESQNLLEIKPGELAKEFMKSNQIIGDQLPEPFLSNLKIYLHGIYQERQEKVPYSKMMMNALPPATKKKSINRFINQLVEELENTCFPAFPINDDERYRHLFLGFHDDLPWKEQIFLMLPKVEDSFQFRFTANDRDRKYFYGPMERRLSYVVLLHNLSLRKNEIFKSIWGEAETHSKNEGE